MALEGELSGLNGVDCCECGKHLELEVLSSPAGYYLGYFCYTCGPHSRETDYFETREKAERELENIKKTGNSESKRNSEFVPGELQLFELDSNQCPFDPTIYKDQPIGMFHCPICGEMVMAGLPHPVPMTDKDWDDYFDHQNIKEPTEKTEDSEDYGDWDDFFGWNKDENEGEEKR